MNKILILLFSFCITLFAQSSVWKISKNGDSIYLGGTVHLLKRSDYPLPKQFDKAYKNSDTIYFETDLQAGNSQSFQQRLFSKMRLENGQTLSSVLNPRTYKRLKAFASKYPINFNQFEGFKPAMIILMLSISELQKLGIDAPGVDLYYENRALSDGKKLGSLETPNDQLNFLASMGEGNENSFVNKSLDDFKKTKFLMPKMTKAWREGNLNKLDNLFAKDMKKDYPKVYKTLLVDRNNNWLPQIKKMFENKNKEFVLVGVGHLVGNDGLIYMLRKDGFTIEQLR